MLSLYRRLRTRARRDYGLFVKRISAIARREDAVDTGTRTLYPYVTGVVKIDCAFKEGRLRIMAYGDERTRHEDFAVFRKLKRSQSRAVSLER